MWTKKSSRKIADELSNSYNIDVCANTICSLLRENGYSLQINHKKIEINRILTKEERYQRNQQFLKIEKLIKKFSKNKFITISVDAKKKEHIGNFINKGATWRNIEKEVYAYDYPSWASGVGIPFGIYDTFHKYGFVNVGTSYNTGKFAVQSIKQYYETFGKKSYENNKKMLILADSGGSNGCRLKLWKYDLQHEICNKFGIEVTVAHYPTGTSKYNLIEHKFFCHISNNWAGNPLIDYETMLNYISTTTTKNGLTANAILDKNTYEKGIRITKKQMDDLNIEFDNKIPKWNYTIYPN